MKTKKIAMFLAAGLMTVSLFSCTENETLEVTFNTNAANSYEIAAENPKAITFSVSSENGSWEIVSDHDWCTIEPRTGEAGREYTVTVQYQDNDTEASRTDKLTLRSGETVGKTITVLQAGLAGQQTSFSVTPTTLSFTSAEETKELTVTSNVSWTAEITEGSDWLSFGTTVSGDGNGTLEVKASANTGAERNGTVTIKGSDGSTLATVSATQESGAGTGAGLAVDQEFVTIAYNEDLTLNITASGGWYAQKDAGEGDWYTLETEHKTGNGTLTVTFEDNTTGGERYAFFTIYSEDGSEEIPVTVTQTAADFVQYFFKDGYQNAGFKFDGAFKDGTEPTYSDEGMTFTGKGRLTHANMKPGTYTVRLKLLRETSDCYVILSYSGPWFEFRLNITDANTAISTSPKPDSQTFNNVPVSVGEWHEYSFTMSELESGYSKIVVSLDGEEVTSFDVTEEFPNAPKYSNFYLYFGGEDAVFEWIQF